MQVEDIVLETDKSLAGELPARILLSVLCERRPLCEYAITIKSNIVIKQMHITYFYKPNYTKEVGTQFKSSFTSIKF